MEKGGDSKKEVKDEQSDMMSKDELLQGMEKVDREIAQVNQQINNLKKMQVRDWDPFYHAWVQIKKSLKKIDSALFFKQNDGLLRWLV